MLCDHCLKNPATVHMTTFVNGQVKAVHLCSPCATKKKGTVVAPWFSFNDFLSAFYDEEEATNVVCDGCGTTLASFKKEGRLGCARCYETFESSILPILKSIHMNTQHTGKRPGERVIVQPGKEAAVSEAQQRREQLKKELREAIAVENFEEAARLRDEIALMESEGD
jgi:protein arginine kinase activator